MNNVTTWAFNNVNQGRAAGGMGEAGTAVSPRLESGPVRGGLDLLTYLTSSPE